MSEKICRHKNLIIGEDTRFKMCKDCKVYLAKREEAHHYVKEYYMNETLQIFKDGIIRRNWYWGLYKQVWDAMDIDLNKFNRVLEIGCGVGRLLWTFNRDLNKECVGVESSNWAYTWMNATLGCDDKFKIYNTNFEWIDKKVLGKFDFIYGCHVFEHFEDAMKGLEECYEMLNDNGYLYIVVPDKEHQKFLHVHNWVFEIDTLKLWFEQLGLKNIKMFMTAPYNGLEDDAKRGHYIHICGQKVKENDK